MKGIWDPKKKKYTDKEEKKSVKWVHKNNYIVGKFGIFKGVNTPYVKPKEDINEGKD